MSRRRLLHAQTAAQQVTAARAPPAFESMAGCAMPLDMEPSDVSGGLESQDAGQRRHVTLLFSDLCDYTRLNELIDPEYIDQLRRLIDAQASSVIARHGGAITQYYGDGILAVFGLPIASEQDARGAVNAALELRALAKSWASAVPLPKDFELGMHFGVHCGLVFARRGDVLHGRYQLTGDAVNTAARLCAAAERDQILVSETALRGIEPFYQTDSVRELTLKGKRLSVPAYHIHSQTGIRTRFEASTYRGLTTLVGRERELSQLQGAIAAVADGGMGRVLALTGSAGMGKTRVLEELARRVPSDVHIYRGTCDSYGSVVPLQPMLGILREMLNLGEVSGERAHDLVQRRCLELGSKLSEHAELIAGVLDLESGSDRAVQPALERRLIEALRALVPALRARLVVLAIDDFQWVDDLTRRVLSGLLREHSCGLMAILAKRELGIDDGVLSAAQHIELTPLSLDDCARVIRSLAPGALDIGLAASMCQRTGGNPLFLEELCRSLPASRASEAYAGEERSVPTTVHGVIQARLSRLPAREQSCLRVAAVIGNEFSKDLLVEVAAAGDIDQVLQRLCAANIVRQVDGEASYRFNHGITREVVYESVRLQERRALHRAVAEKLQQRAADGGVQAQNEALAHHFVGSGDHARAAHHAELAGDRAAAASALDRARAQYGTALAELDLLEQTPELSRRWLAVSLKWARASVYCQAPDQLKVLERAARLAEELYDLNERADVAQMSAWICYALGEQQAAIDHCQRGLALAEQIGNHKQVGQLTSNLGQSYAAAGQYALALPLLERAVELKRSGARQGERSVPVGFAYALSVSAAIYADQGDFARADQIKERALAAVSGRGHPIEASMLGVCAMGELWQGDLEACIATCQRAIEAAERVWGPYVFCICEAMSAYSKFMLTRDLQQYERLCRAVDWLETRSMGLYLSMAYGCAAEASLLAAQPERARVAAERALGRAAHSDPFGEAVAYRVFAELEAAERGTYDEQVSTWLKWADNAARTRGTEREHLLNKLCHARILQSTGNASEAEAVFAETHHALDLMGMKLHEHR